MRISSGFFVGILASFGLIACLGVAAVFSGFIPANANAKPSTLERTMARISLNATIRREAPQGDAPIPMSDANLTQGVLLYGQNCAVCHGTTKDKPTAIARGLYQKPPQFMRDDVTDDPVGVTYWKVHNGIRLTGMPAFSDSLTEKQQWQIVLFLKRMNDLPLHANLAWHHL